MNHCGGVASRCGCGSVVVVCGSNNGSPCPASVKWPLCHRERTTDVFTWPIQNICSE